MDFSKLKALTIPQGVVQSISKDGVIIWSVESGLPSIYQEVVYLRAEINAETYIDLGFAFDTSAEIYLTQWVPTKTVTAYPFGAAENSGVLRCLLSSPYSGMPVFYGSSGTAYGSSATEFNPNGERNDLQMIIKKGHRQINNLTININGNITTGQGEYTMTNNLYLFAQNYNGTPRFGSLRIIGKFQYYDKNNELICDLVPCYRKSDNVRGMYDLVRKTFLTNIGKGADFSIGPAINNDTILLNLNRKQGTDYTNDWKNETVYLNPASYMSTIEHNGTPCGISHLTQNSITVTESGKGGYGVAFPFNIYYPDVRVDRRGKSFTLTWDATGTTNTRFRLMISDGTSLQYVDLDNGDGTITSATFAISVYGKIIKVNGTSYTFDDTVRWSAFHFSSKTSTTTSYKNVNMVDNNVNQVPISTNADGSIYNGVGYKDGYRIRSGGAEGESEFAIATGFIPFKKGDTVYIYAPFIGGNGENAINFADANFTNLGQFTDYGSRYGICRYDETYKATTENGITSFTLTDAHNGSADVAYIRITNAKHALSTFESGADMIVTVNQELF